jgi:hypothetical protein
MAKHIHLQMGFFLPFANSIETALPMFNLSTGWSLSYISGYLCLMVLGLNQKSFLLLWQKLKWQKISICRCDFFRHLQIGLKLLYKCLTYALHWLVHKLQVCKLVAIEFVPSNVNGRQFSNLQMDICIVPFQLLA